MKAGDKMSKTETEETKVKTYSKNALLKNEYLQQHLRVAKVVLEDGKSYTEEQAVNLVKKYLGGK